MVRHLTPDYLIGIMQVYEALAERGPGWPPIGEFVHALRAVHLANVAAYSYVYSNRRAIDPGYSFSSLFTSRLSPALTRPVINTERKREFYWMLEYCILQCSCYSDLCFLPLKYREILEWVQRLTLESVIEDLTQCAQPA